MTRTAAKKQSVEDLIELCRVDNIPLRGSRVVKVPGGEIALFRTAENEIYALQDSCPHAGGPLSQGIVHGNAVTCPLHNWVISLETGKALGADQGEVATIPVRLERGRISLARSDLSRLRKCIRIRCPDRSSAAPDDG
ncbi:MAG: nitrite reductase small subunit NirD [Hyphomicrobiaceae bacterium]|nr:MAG: nitrite reductase small subunit NirD [Hyphomicrobiaceae bacterium]